MQKLLLVEDDTIQTEELLISIHNKYPNWNIVCATNYDKAHELIIASAKTTDYFSLFLLDVQLEKNSNDTGGFTLANVIRSLEAYYRTPILFLTSVTDKTQFALSNYHCYNYITKPYLASDILFQIQQMLQTGYLQEHAISITDTKRIRHRIVLDDIYFIESQSHTLIFSTKQGNITTRNFTFAELASQLSDDFVQCHKKYIININYVNHYDKTNRYVTLDQNTISVSRT